ncbi:hypothetical protein GJ496_005267 [Pomphorhynchus laevis]|nr:hypothetical protein GJ496_005267 [Pomphorhynchus laevis]
MGNNQSSPNSTRNDTNSVYQTKTLQSVNIRSTLSNPQRTRVYSNSDNVFTFTPLEDFGGLGMRQSSPVTIDTGQPDDVINEDLQKPTVPVVFRFEVPANTSKHKEVSVSGSFSDWKKMIPMVRSDNDFLAIIELPEGEYQYKFWTDGKWEINPNEPTLNDGFNGKNNVVIVQESDFEVMTALRADAAAATKCDGANCEDRPASPMPNESYVSEVPLRGFPNVLDRPPLLPPHLTNIILNRDTSKSCEPTLLPEPNHVMLKHLYALSIRDGVIVLSTTSRHREKYVTTCFYKPI